MPDISNLKVFTFYYIYINTFENTNDENYLINLHSTIFILIRTRLLVLLL